MIYVQQVLNKLLAKKEIAFSLFNSKQFVLSVC